MRHAVLILLLLISFVLAGCGGRSEDDTPQVVSSPTPQPTLTIEERIQFPAGQAENPLRMVIRPVDTVNRRIATILTDELDLRAAQARPDASLADVLEDDDNMAALNAALLRDFGVQITGDEASTVATVGELIRHVQGQIGEQVSADIFDRTSLYVNVVLVDDYGNALDNLCASGGGIVSISWLDGITYQAATAQRCGQPALQVAVAEGFEEDFSVEPVEATPEATSEATPDVDEDNEEEPPAEMVASQFRTGTPGVLFTNSSFGSDSIVLVEDRIFCRLGVDDLYSWFLPALVMDQNNLDPLRAPSAIIDYASPEALVDAVESGDCAMSGLAQDQYEMLASDDLVVVDETAAFPYGILMYPLEVGLGVRLSITENLIAIAEDPEDGRTLRLLLGQNALLPAEPNDFEALDAYLTATGYDFAQLGN